MYEGISYESILERMLNRVPNTFDKREGSIIYDALAPAAMEVMSMYLELENVLTETFADTASRQYLIKRTAERGIVPYSASKASLKAVSIPASLEIRIGSRFSLNELDYAVTSKMEDGVYTIECETEGAIGNKYFGKLIPIDYIDGLESIEIVELLIPGEDEESTDSIRKRYFESFSSQAYGGNQKDYIQKTNAISGVGGTKVTRVWNGDIRPADMIPSEAVKQWYEAIKPSLSGETAVWLEAVFHAAKQKKLTTGGTVMLTIINSDYDTASEALISSVQETIDPETNAGEGYGAAPIGHVVSVESVQARNVTIKIDVVFDTGYGWDNLQNSINAAISDYLLELRKSWADSSYLIVRISQIETRVLGIKGIVDIRDTEINGSGENLILGEYEIPVFGGAGAW